MGANKADSSWGCLHMDRSASGVVNHDICDDGLSRYLREHVRSAASSVRFEFFVVIEAFASLSL